MQINVGLTNKERAEEDNRGKTDEQFPSQLTLYLLLFIFFVVLFSRRNYCVLEGVLASLCLFVYRNYLQLQIQSAQYIKLGKLSPRLESNHATQLITLLHERSTRFWILQYWHGILLFEHYPFLFTKMCFLTSQVFTVCAHRITGVQQCPVSRKRQEEERHKFEGHICKFIGYGASRSTKSTGQIIFGWCPECTSTFTGGNILDGKVIRRYWAIKGLFFIERPIRSKIINGAYLFSTFYDGILDDELLGDQVSCEELSLAHTLGVFDKAPESVKQCAPCTRELINGTLIGPYLNGVRESTLEWARSLSRTGVTNIATRSRLSTIPETPDEHAERRSEGAVGDSAARQTGCDGNDVSPKDSVPNTFNGANDLERTAVHDTRSGIEARRPSILRKDFLPYVPFF